MANIKVKLVKSTIGSNQKQKATVEALGLRKIGQVIEKKDDAAIRGMVKKVAHLVEIIEA
ncbi:MAG: 50S ribosomal protein L30 [Clostridia bacterium]|jgi:large subunit ribosomal protein L30|nr:50S ribosomal protein L30 [Clostridia bacterium]